MPELPEVETVRRSLEPLVPHKQITAVEIFKPSLLALGDEAAFAALVGAEIGEINRRGKYLLFSVQTAEPLCWVVHLRMTGKLLYRPQALPLEKHDLARLTFADGSELVYNDMRGFGRFWLTQDGPEGLAQVSGLNSLGLEPLDADFSVEYWQEKIKRRPRAMVKAALLDQTVVAGLGNIYADEVLFQAQVHPERPLGSLTESENQRLTQAMREILQASIEQRGTTFRDYVDGNNEKGGYQESLRVFQKKGQPCPNCQGEIQRIKVAGRSSYFCPHCQVK